MASAAARVAAVAASAARLSRAAASLEFFEPGFECVSRRALGMAVDLKSGGTREHLALQQIKLFRPRFRSRTRGSSSRATGLLALATARSRSSGVFLRCPVTYHPLPLPSQIER